eukprot:5748329-Pyramimonas_sp.AAC.1
MRPVPELGLCERPLASERLLWEQNVQGGLELLKHNCLCCTWGRGMGRKEVSRPQKSKESKHCWLVSAYLVMICRTNFTNARGAETLSKPAATVSIGRSTPRLAALLGLGRLRATRRDADARPPAARTTRAARGE